ncbi:MAG: ribosome biogenesis GTPase Der [Ilumatobacteraceae bacterium]|nr:ribosome biogenesis GTPase Der [Ilumatobacteraceae bacterium]
MTNADARKSVVIVGRPNVGKSTLFNRFVGEQAAIVEDHPGVTRDRHTREVEWCGYHFNVVDTGGWMPGGSALDSKVSRQVEAAARTADIVLFVVDATVGLNDDDESIAAWLRATGRPILLVANKVDGPNAETDLWQFLSLGLGDAVPVSAIHGRKSGDLLDVIVDQLEIEADDPSAAGTFVRNPETKEPRVAIVGRPNVGKSTLFNRLVGEERSIVHDMAGTTRDAVDTRVETSDGPVIFVDTAGMRRRSKVEAGTEYYSIIRALRAVDESDIALLVIDATEGVTSQDQRLAERIDASGCPIVLVLNKWEMLDSERREQVEIELRRRLYFIGDSPIVRLSALTGKNVHRLQPLLTEAITNYHKRVPTRDVNRVLAAAQQQQPAGQGARVLYALQGAVDPPTFTLFVNRELPQTYLRYLERSIREAFEFGSTPIKLRVRTRSEQG